MRIQPGSDGSSADRQIVESVERLLQAMDVALQQAGPAAEFLADGQRHGVLQVGTPDLDHVIEFLRLGRDRVVHVLIAGISAFFTRSAAAMCMAAGNVSFEDCDMLTSSLG